MVKEEDNAQKGDNCSIWFHAGCMGLSQDAYSCLVKEKAMLWFYKRCRPTVLTDMKEHI